MRFLQCFEDVVHQNILLHQFPLTVSHGLQASLLCSECLSLPPSVCRCKQGSSRTAAAASSRPGEELLQPGAG